MIGSLNDTTEVFEETVQKITLKTQNAADVVYFTVARKICKFNLSARGRSQHRHVHGYGWNVRGFHRVKRMWLQLLTVVVVVVVVDACWFF